MISGKIVIDRDLFYYAFAMDRDYHNPYDMSSFLNLENGMIVFVYDSDDNAYMDGSDPLENKKLKKQIDSDRNKYLEIPQLAHGEYHEMLLSFLSSDWTQDSHLRRIASNAYSGSIGGWLDELYENYKSYVDEIVEKWQLYLRDEIEKRIEKFLKDNGVIYEWC